MRCFYNHDMCAVASAKTPWLTYDSDIDMRQVKGFVYDIADTDVDTFLCCPTMLRQPLWRSEVMPHWQNEAPGMQEPHLCHDWKYFEYIYYRYRRYILDGGDPVKDTVEAAKEIGCKIYFSYRMNDEHELANHPESPHIDSFWRDHPQYRIGDFDGNAPLVPKRTAVLLQDYFKPEVRNHYLNVIEELLSLYDVDGFEFDFMRAPCYFSPARLAEGTQIMTQFVRDVRRKLIRHGEKRGKTLELSARVPALPEMAKAIGLDISAWDAEGSIDFVNINDGFFLSCCPGVEEYRSCIRNAKILGELQFAVSGGKGIGNSATRKATREQYRTVAHNFLERGADGVSFYNFTFARHHYFNDPRRSMYPGTEPPFDCLKDITNLEKLRKEPKHYYWGADSLKANKQDRWASLAFDLYDHCDDVKEALMRIETEDINTGIDLTVALNGKELIEVVDTGELFRPLTIEALPINEKTRYFTVPVSFLTYKSNTLNMQAISQCRRGFNCIGVELALRR